MGLVFYGTAIDESNAVSTVYLLLILLLNLIFTAFVYWKIVLPLMCCVIRVVLHPVRSAASDPWLELYKINFNFQSRILFKRVSYAYSSALDRIRRVFKLFLMAIDSNADPFPIFVLIRIQWSFQSDPQLIYRLPRVPHTRDPPYLFTYRGSL